MNQRDLILILAREYGLPKSFADDIIKTILNAIATELNKGERVRLRNFGTFEMRLSHGKLRPKFNPSKNMLGVRGRGIESLSPNPPKKKKSLWPF